MKIKIPDGQTVRCTKCRQPASDILMLHDGSLYCFHCWAFDFGYIEKDSNEWSKHICMIEGERNG